VVLELILFLPVLFLLLCAVVEFGLIQANLVHLASASRAGAKLAAESVGIEGSTPKDLVLKIQASLDRHFQSAGLGSEAV
jgi:Flp pilus assembly protein TadG